MKIFLSGSYSITKIPPGTQALLDKVIERGDTLLVGDCKGADTAFQQYLADKGCRNVEVYASGTPRNFLGEELGWQIHKVRVPYGVTGREYHTYKDVEMTKDCDKAILLWDGKSKGTQNNLDRLNEYGKSYALFKKSNKTLERN